LLCRMFATVMTIPLRHNALKRIAREPSRQLPRNTAERTPAHTKPAPSDKPPPTAQQSHTRAQTLPNPPHRMRAPPFWGPFALIGEGAAR
jgi:hypothetical protein